MYYNISKPFGLYVADNIATGLEGSLVCWIFFWKNEYRKAKILFADKSSTFDQPRNTEIELCTVKV